MPRSKHRRKPGGKAVRHPGRGTPREPALSQEDVLWHRFAGDGISVDVVKDVPTDGGGFIYPLSEFATPDDQLTKRLSNQEDPSAAIKEAKSLLAAAGQGRDAQPRFTTANERRIHASSHPRGK